MAKLIFFWCKVHETLYLVPYFCLSIQSLIFVIVCLKQEKQNNLILKYHEYNVPATYYNKLNQNILKPLLLSKYVQIE